MVELINFSHRHINSWIDEGMGKINGYSQPFLEIQSQTKDKGHGIYFLLLILEGIRGG